GGRPFWDGGQRPVSGGETIDESPRAAMGVLTVAAFRHEPKCTAFCEGSPTRRHASIEGSGSKLAGGTQMLSRHEPYQKLTSTCPLKAWSVARLPYWPE